MKKNKIFSYLSPLVLVSGVVPMLATTSCKKTSIQYISHRGLSSQYFENTAQAFEAAGKEEKQWGIETDIYLTADNKLVCAHDINPFRNTGLITRDATLNETDGSWDIHSGDSIRDYDLSAVEKKELWTGHVEKNSNGKYVSVDEENLYGIGGEQHAPSFVDYLNICKTYNKEAVIEIKDENISVAGQTASLLISELIAEITEVGYLEHSTIIAFDDPSFNRSEPFYNQLKEKDKTPGQILVKKFQKLCWVDTNHDNPAQDALAAINKNQNVDIDATKITRTIIKKAHAKKLLVNTWTVNDTSERDRLVKMGVDQITGNVIF